MSSRNTQPGTPKGRPTNRQADRSDTDGEYSGDIDQARRVIRDAWRDYIDDALRYSHHPYASWDVSWYALLDEVTEWALDIGTTTSDAALIEGLAHAIEKAHAIGAACERDADARRAEWASQQRRDAAHIQLALDHTCPRCGSTEGVRCVTTSGPNEGRQQKRTHQSRLDQVTAEAIDQATGADDA